MTTRTLPKTGKRQTLKLKYLTITGLMAAMITIMTAYICHIPTGINGGYIHFGDSLIYLAAAILPTPYALAAAAVGGGSCHRRHQDCDRTSLHQQARKDRHTAQRGCLSHRVSYLGLWLFSRRVSPLWHDAGADRLPVRQSGTVRRQRCLLRRIWPGTRQDTCKIQAAQCRVARSSAFY